MGRLERRRHGPRLRRQGRRQQLAQDGEEPLAAPSLAREALDAGKAVALAQSGAISGPDTAAFVASVPERDDHDAIASQVIESGAQVILAGGGRYMLPAGTQGRHGEGAREDGANLVERAKALGCTVVYTRDERLAHDPATTPKVLGLFAADHTCNDQDWELNDLQGKPTCVETAPATGEMADWALRASRATRRLLRSDRGGGNRQPRRRHDRGGHPRGPGAPTRPWA